MQAIAVQLAGLIKPYLYQVSVILVTCSLVVTDSYINQTVRRGIKGFNFVLRVVIYMLLFTFVYGVLVTFLSPIVYRFMIALNSGLLLLSLLSSFIVLGVLMDRK